MVGHDMGFDSLVVLSSEETPQLVHVPTEALPLAALLISATVVVIYGQRGWSTVASVMVYLASLSSITLSVKWVMEHDFVFPKLITTCHFLVGALVTAAILAWRKRQGSPIPVPTAQEFWMLIFPIAMAVAFSIGLNNTALTFNSAAFTEVMGATNSLMTMGVVAVMGMPVSTSLIPPAVLVTFGCIISTAGEMHFSTLGVILCLSAAFFRSLKVALQQRLLSGGTRDKFDPVALLFWISLPSTLTMFGFSVMYEGMEPYTVVSKKVGPPFWSLCLALAASCALATVLNIAQLFVTKELGAVGSQLTAQTKMVLVILGGMILFQEEVTQFEFAGFFLVITGVYWFSREDQKAKDGEKAKDGPNTERTSLVDSKASNDKGAAVV